ncbi:universal stress protein [Desulfobulbus alkaliphilus]|uniref:universal stress protein n=1 Tax=Desulfobulbus alkaliphilus TaxID=869814 RepID=UPI001962B03D|nr:universal stress protein [Desulfobulbus alkaliphilus]MBM9536458.1 universal stress protein [Desulfobulbus alkaliphilus]
MMIKVRRVAVPIDFSENSKKAVLYGMEIAKGQQAKLYLLHIINQRLIDTMQELSLKGYKEDFLDAMKSMLQEREADLKEFTPADSMQDLDIDYTIRKGKPGEEIVKFAKENKIGMIVMGTQGRTAFADVFVGSTTRTVINRVKCPVLVVHPDDEDLED